MTTSKKRPCNALPAFHKACIRNDAIDDISALLDSDPTLVSIVSFDDGGNTALHYACAAGNLEVVKLLLKRGAALDKKNDMGWTPLMQACFNGQSDVVSVLIQAQANVNAINKLNCSALSFACYSGCEKSVRSLIEAGAQFSPGSSPNEPAMPCFNPILAACVPGNAEALSVVMNAFQSTAVNMKDGYNGETPLAISSVFNWTHLVEMLLKEGADPDVVDVNNRTALDLATLSKSKPCKSILKAKTEKNMTSSEVHPIEHPIIEMAKQGNLKGVKEILDKEPKLVGARNSEDGATVLMYACVAGHLGVVKLLVSRGAHLDEQDYLSGWTSLMQATFHNNTEIVKFLLEQGCDISTRSHQGINAFDIASLMDNVDSEITQVLAAKLKSKLPSSSTEEHLSSHVGGTLSSHSSNIGGSIPVLNSNEDDNSSIAVNLDSQMRSGVVKNIWGKVTDKLKNLKKFGQNEPTNRVSVMPTNPNHRGKDLNNFEYNSTGAAIGGGGLGVGSGGPRYGGWVSVSDNMGGGAATGGPGSGDILLSGPSVWGPLGSGVFGGQHPEILESGIFSTPSMYKMNVEPCHMQAHKQLATPVVPPFCMTSSLLEMNNNNLQLSRHKSSFATKQHRHNNISTGTGAASNVKQQFKPMKSNPPKFLQPKKPPQPTASGTKFEASEHSNHISPQSSGDFKRQHSFRIMRHNSPPNFATSQHVTSPPPIAASISPRINANASLSGNSSLQHSKNAAASSAEQPATFGASGDQWSSQEGGGNRYPHGWATNNPGQHMGRQNTGSSQHCHKPSFGSSISSGDFNLSQGHPSNSNSRSAIGGGGGISTHVECSSPINTDHQSRISGRVAASSSNYSSSHNRQASIESSSFLGFSAEVIASAHQTALVSSSSGSNIGGQSRTTAAPSRCEMSQILSQLALLKYKHIFEQQEVDAEVLLSLTEKDLDEMGIEQKSSKEHILRAISHYNKAQQQQQHSQLTHTNSASPASTGNPRSAAASYQKATSHAGRVSASVS